MQVISNFGGPRTCSRSMASTRLKRSSFASRGAARCGKFKALPACLVGMEACATAHWARELTKLGHGVRLMPWCHAKAYVKRSK